MPRHCTTIFPKIKKGVAVSSKHSPRKGSDLHRCALHGNDEAVRRVHRETGQSAQPATRNCSSLGAAEGALELALHTLGWQVPGIIFLA
jgi:hypothetical protein